jgi:hypothetical protein
VIDDLLNFGGRSEIAVYKGFQPGVIEPGVIRELLFLLGVCGAYGQTRPGNFHIFSAFEQMRAYILGRISLVPGELLGAVDEARQPVKCSKIFENRLQPDGAAGEETGIVIDSKTLAIGY